jgi:antitoxin component YwqK of YwqJK toxin-antitoxin module
MKQIFSLTLISLLFISCGDQQSNTKKTSLQIYDLNQTTIVDNVCYEKNSTKKITGVVRAYAKDEQNLSKLLFEAPVLNGIPHGIRVKYYSSGNIHIKSSYKQGKREGDTTIYYPNGKTKSITPYHQNKIDGIEKYYNQNGILLLEISYKSGQKEGISKQYYPSGKLQYETPFKKGKIDGIKKGYYENGTIGVELSYKNGQKEGVRRSYYPSGQLKEENTYHNDLLDGEIKNYYESGELHLKATFEAGHCIGEKIEYDKSSKVIERVQCEENKEHNSTDNR